MTDIDIDFADRTEILSLIEHIPASMSGGRSHNTGIYCHKIPIDPFSGRASIEYKEAEERGYFKIDFLNVNIYNKIKNEEHLIQLMNREPIWELLEEKEFVDMLFHINGHCSILKEMKPKNVEQLAAILAIIRPAKRYLLGKNWNEVMKEIWIKPANDDYYFKKAHGISYATAIVVQMNLICEGTS